VEADHCNSEVAISHIGGPITVDLCNNTCSYVYFYCKWISPIDSAANFGIYRLCPTLFSQF